MLALGVLAACGGAEDDRDVTEGFTTRLRAGADCAELFEIRNEFDPKSPRIDAMNEQLREIGCYMSGSERTD